MIQAPHLELISLHIPKTAGTSFRSNLVNVYGKKAVARFDILKGKIWLDEKECTLCLACRIAWNISSNFS